MIICMLILPTPCPPPFEKGGGTQYANLNLFTTPLSAGKKGKRDMQA